MNLQDLWVISPALAVVTIALIVMMADIAIKNRRVVLYVTILLLLIPLALQVVLWLDDGASVVGFGGTISADKFALFAQMLITVTLILILGGSSHYVEKLDEYRGEYLALTLFSVAGMLLLVAARELITMYVAFELTAIPLAVLIVLLRSRTSIEAGVKFLILSALGSALMLFGIVLIFAYSGSTHFVTIGQSLATIGSIGLPGVLALAVGMIMVVAGLGFKMSIAPWQMWVPDVYRGAPLPVSVFLSTASKTSAFVALASLTYIAFAGTELGNEWSLILAFSAVASMTVGNLGALRQSNLKRLLAYSTIAQAGYMLVGLAAITTEGETALLGNGAGALVLYLVSYTVTNIAVFMSILHFSSQRGRSDFEALRGIGRSNPFWATIITIGVLSLIGIPVTSGFIAKLTIFGAGVSANLLWLVIIGVLNSVLAVYYYMRILKTMFLEEPDETLPKLRSNPALIAVVTVCTVAVIVIGIMPFVIGDFANEAARDLLAFVGLVSN